MGRSPAIVLFVGGVLLVVAGLHYYLWRRLIRDAQLAAPWRTIATAGLLAAVLSLVSSLFLARVSFPLKGLLLWPGLTWIGAMFLLFVTLLATDLVQLGVSLRRRLGEHRQWIPGDGRFLPG